MAFTVCYVFFATSSLLFIDRGTNGADIMTGLGDRDVLFGNKGTDVLWGGEGNDQLTGGADSDFFVLSRGEGRDRIRDFRLGK